MAVRRILLALFLCSIFLGAPPSRAAPAPEGQDSALVDAVLASMDTRDRIGQLFVVGFNGAELTPEVSAFINDHKVGGVFLSRETCNIVNGSLQDPKQCGFGDDPNPDTPAQVAKLNGQLQQASCAATATTVDGVQYCLPMFITVDHEGDDRPSTRLLNRFTPIPSNMAIGATFDSAEAEAVGCIVGQELSAVGVNMLFGPDLDVLDSPRSGGPGDQGIRVFGGDPRWVGEMGEAYVRGVQECSGGSLSTVSKHFPGHGRSTRGVDYEDIPVIVGKTLDMLAASDLPPFAAVSQGKPGDAGVADGVMNSHLSYPEVAGCAGGAPITFSPSCMQSFFGLPVFAAWRTAGGVTVADDLASGAVQAYAQDKFGTYRQADVALEALLAGNDLLPLIRPWQWQDLGPTIDYLASRYEADPAVKQRVDDAARRILTLKLRLSGGLEPATVTKPLVYQGKVGQADKAAEVAALAEKSLTMIKPATVDQLRSSVPAPSAGQRILFIECWADPNCATPTDLDAYPPLWPRGKLAALVTQMFPGRIEAQNLRTISFSELGAVLTGGGDEQVRNAVKEADWLVFAFLERDATHYPATEVLKDFLGRGPALFDLRSKQVAVFAYNSPYHLDAGELRNVDLFAAAYTRTEPALRATLKLLFQDTTLDAGGVLPVDYIYGDYVLYDLSEEVKAEPGQSLEIAVEPEAPQPGDEVVVSLTKPLLAVNGRRVPDGARVDFAFELPNGKPKLVTATTVDGLASAKLIVADSGDLKLAISSDALDWSPSQPIVVGSGGGGLSTSASSDRPAVLFGAFTAVAIVLAVVGLVVYRLRGGPQAVVATVETAAESPAEATHAAVEPSALEQELRVDTATQRAYVKGKEVPLSREQYTLLACLFENAGKVCLREEIISRAWPDDHAGGVSDEAVDALVHRLRDRLRAAGASKLLIMTIRGRGFRLDL